MRERLRWVAELSDGTTAYEDDGRPGVSPRSAWVRLRAHCEARGLRIVQLWLQFRSNRVPLPRGKDGYFLAKCAFGVWGEDESHTGYVAGYVEGGRAVVTRYKAPELDAMETEERPVDPASPCFILGEGRRDGDLRERVRGVEAPDGGPEARRDGLLAEGGGHRPGDRPAVLG